MAIDTKKPKGYRKAWNGGVRPEMPADAIGICTSCGTYILTGRTACEPPCAKPSAFMLPTDEARP